MKSSISIDPQTGAICLADQIRLEAGQPKSVVEPLVGEWLDGSRDFGNGYEWLDLRRLSFGGQPAGLGLCFHAGLLDHVSWSVNLPDAPTEAGWPTRKAIEDELSFVRGELVRQLRLTPGQCGMTFDWGEVWSLFDAKGFLASNGLRYRRG